jgi:hypothetical protein
MGNKGARRDIWELQAEARPQPLLTAGLYRTDLQTNPLHLPLFVERHANPLPDLEASLLAQSLVLKAMPK